MEQQQEEPQPPKAEVEDDEDELEEGELKDDDDDDDDDDMDTPMVDPRAQLMGSAMLGTGLQGPEGINNNNSSTSNVLADDPDADGLPKKKRKRVVRKVKRKIKVIKKVPKKKADQPPQPQPSPQPPPPQLEQQTTNKPLLTQPIQRTVKNNGNNSQQTANTNINHQQTQQQPKRLLPLPSDQHQTNVNPTLAPMPTTTLDPSLAATSSANSNQSVNLDNLWEQQILMLQQLQKQQQQTLPPQLHNNQIPQPDQHAQILRAAATDEDLRFLQTPSMFQTTNNFIPTTQTMNQQSQPPPQQQLQPPQTILQQQTIQQPNVNPTTLHDTTPSSPDDEHGKSSYEAISKMLTMLRNSANVSDSSSEMINEADPRLKGQQQRHLQQQQNQPQPQPQPQQQQQQQPDAEDKYLLIPVQVDGIDYTRYKLLSQYEPKFNNDPRLNQQGRRPLDQFG